MRLLKDILSTWFGAGFSPVAPGTAGTLAAIPVVLLLWWAGSWPLHLGAAFIVSALGIWAAGDAEQRWDRTDPRFVVIDEVAGFLVATFLAPPSALTLAAAFFLFRLFDVVKPWPLRKLEHLPGAWGIMADDLGAGVYTNLLLAAGAAAARGWLG